MEPTTYHSFRDSWMQLLLLRWCVLQSLEESPMAVVGHPCILWLFRAPRVPCLKFETFNGDNPPVTLKEICVRDICRSWSRNPRFFFLWGCFDLRPIQHSTHVPDCAYAILVVFRLKEQDEGWVNHHHHLCTLMGKMEAEWKGRGSFKCVICFYWVISAV